MDALVTSFFETSYLSMILELVEPCRKLTCKLTLINAK
jgi:hypothetical protein